MSGLQFKPRIRHPVWPVGIISFGIGLTAVWIGLLGFWLYKLIDLAI